MFVEIVLEWLIGWGSNVFAVPRMRVVTLVSEWGSCWRKAPLVNKILLLMLKRVVAQLLELRNFVEGDVAARMLVHWRVIIDAEH